VGTVHLDGSVLVADGDEEARAELQQVLTTGGWHVVQAETGPDALRLAGELTLLAVILEVPLPGLSGYEVCRSLKADFGDRLPILFVTGARTESYDRVAGLLIGADDYVVKPCAPDEILVRTRNLIARVPRAEQARAVPLLTRREREILGLLSDGLPQREIASRLFISPKTVSTHIENLTRKLGVRGRAQAVAMAYRDHLLGA
jgi:DNA-binding NarL/FixJ family response regulator